jgi:hypothetical protein
LGIFEHKAVCSTIACARYRKDVVILVESSKEGRSTLAR